MELDFFEEMKSEADSLKIIMYIFVMGYRRNYTSVYRRKCFSELAVLTAREYIFAAVRILLY